MMDDNKYIDDEVRREIEREKEKREATELLKEYVDKGLIDIHIYNYARTDKLFANLLSDALR